jgi:hypothetical protein
MEGVMNKRMFRMAALLSMLAFAGACESKGSPTSPTQPPENPPTTTPPQTAPSPIRVTSALDGQPISGATVRVNGVEKTTDGNGVVMFDGLTPMADIEIRASDYITRNTRYYDQNLSLIPTSDESGWRVIVLNNYASPNASARSGSTMCVILPQSFRNDPSIVASFVKAAEVVTRGTDGQINTSVAEGCSGNLMVEVLEIGALHTVPKTNPDQSGRPELVGATLSTDANAARNYRVMAHELTHAIGVTGHNPNRGIMAYGSGNNTDDYTPEERRLIKYLLHRRSGTKLVDDDRNSRS